MKTEVSVLFTHAREQFMAPSQVHSLLLHHLDRKRFAVHLACISGRGSETVPSFKVFKTIPNVHLRPTQFGPTITSRSRTGIIRSVISTGLPSIVSLVGLALYIKRHNIDIIHTEYHRDAFYGVLLAKLAGIKAVVHIHSVYGDWMGGRLRWAMRQADGIIVISQFVAQSVIDAGYPPEKIHCVFNGIDPKIWNYDTDRNLIREELGIPPEVHLLVGISRLVPGKGYKLLLEALALVRDQVPDIKLLIVGGEDPATTSPYGPVLKQITHELKLDEHVVFTGPRSDVQQILAASDLFTMPADKEGFGLSFAEAMAMKKPVIALDNGATPEVVEHGLSGLLSPPEDHQKLAENILRLVNDPALRRQMGEHGRMRIEQHFNLQRMTDEVEQTYQLVLKQSRVPKQS